MTDASLLLHVGIEFTLPLSNPILKFLIILLIILFTPILLNKVRIAHLLGLIIAGAVIGPNGFNLLERDSSIILSGTAGLLYIMFLAGLEIDMADFSKNSGKSIVFGLYTFINPMALGTSAAHYLAGFASYHPTMQRLADQLNKYFKKNSYLLIYPIQERPGSGKAFDRKNPAIIEPLEKLDEIGKTLARFIRRGKI